MGNEKERVKISENIDVARVIFVAIRLAEVAGFEQTEQYMVGTATSELARNILAYANEGEVIIRTLIRGTKKGIEVVAEDNGPGIVDTQAAVKDHFSTSGSLGLGLSGAKRLMGEFRIESKLGVGTKITMRKWV